MGDPVAELDQEASALKSAAKTVATFYKELIAEGMPPDEASWLSRDWFADYLENR